VHSDRTGHCHVLTREIFTRQSSPAGIGGRHQPVRARQSQLRRRRDTHEEHGSIEPKIDTSAPACDDLHTKKNATTNPF
jgi:hypothetical protein